MSETGKPLPKILMVEDSVELQHTAQIRLAGIAEVIPAYTLEEAQMRFAEHGNSLTAISFDAEVPDSRHLSLPLIASIKASGYEGAMIAASSSRRLTREMVEAGCQYSIDRSKGEIYGILGVILRKQEAAPAPSVPGEIKRAPQPLRPK